MVLIEAFICLISLIVILVLPEVAFKRSKKAAMCSLILYFQIYLLLFYNKEYKNMFNLIDVILLLTLIWLIEHRPKQIMLIKYQGIVEFDLIYRGIVLSSFFYFLLFRKIYIPISLEISIHSWLIFLGLTLGIIVFNAVIFIALGLLKISPCNKKLKDVYLLFIYMFFIVVPAQEIIFRGLVYKLLQQIWQMQWLSLLLSSLIFGCCHIKYGGWKFAFLSTITGVIYGLIFILTGNIFLAILSHTCVNLVWKLFFTKKTKN